MTMRPDPTREPARSDAGRGDRFTDILGRRLERRGFLRVGGALAAMVLTGVRTSATPPRRFGADPQPRFSPIVPRLGQEPLVPEGHRISSLLRWGDPLFRDAYPFVPGHTDAAKQARQAGYNCDFVEFFPLPAGSQASDHGLLVVNHEYTDPTLMFAGYVPGSPTRAQTDMELEAHGMTVVEVRRLNGAWGSVLGSRLNRRITLTTDIALTGPAAGHPWLRTSADPKGRTVSGTSNNCGGGVTPWGTLLSAEENFQEYFANRDALADGDVAAAHRRYGIPERETRRAWERHHPRFDLAQEPNEPFRFGWVVEVDPYDPTSTPQKRTALGRFRHEAATLTLAADRRAVVYSGDDAAFEYVYRFVSADPVHPEDRARNLDLLDRGTLYVARFEEDGTGRWIPLVQGEGPLVPENGFASPGDVLINTRTAADLVGATKMDRPEDIETNPVNGRVYLALTNNVDRGGDGQPGPDAANPRAGNRYGHILELAYPDGDHASDAFRWEVFILCGDPDDPASVPPGASPSEVSLLAAPDTLAFDRHGNLWIATDGQPSRLAVNDGLYAVPTEGPHRGQVMPFFSSVIGSELCGPAFTPDGTTLFLAIQHPGEGSTFEAPSTRWPDGQGPPRPTVIAVQREDGGEVGRG
jgi:hypothetical protein